MRDPFFHEEWETISQTENLFGKDVYVYRRPEPKENPTGYLYMTFVEVNMTGEYTQSTCFVPNVVLIGANVEKPSNTKLLTQDANLDTMFA